jgi:AmmeMemoRadiSam system protein B
MRKEAVSGSFYPGSRAKISAFIRSALNSAEVKEKPVEGSYSYVAPHAGYEYSGTTAAYTYKAMSLNKDFDKIETVVIIGPNHTGYGKALSVSFEDWHTPLGAATNDLEFSKALVAESNALSADEEAHLYEHSIEVQLPFLQTIFDKRRNIKYAFICMGNQSLEASTLLAESLLSVEKKLGRRITVLASSDFNHYESADVAKSKDNRLIEALLKLDYKRFNELIYAINDSACGFGPITVALLYAKSKGSSKGLLLKYSNSGEATGDFSSVVAYASLAFV